MTSLVYLPSGNPGKFSTSVVVVSWPPAAMPLAMNPCKVPHRAGTQTTQSPRLLATLPLLPCSASNTLL